MPLLQQYDSISPSGAQQLQVGPGSHVVWGSRSLHTTPIDIISNMGALDQIPQVSHVLPDMSSTMFLHLPIAHRSCSLCFPARSLKPICRTVSALLCLFPRSHQIIFRWQHHYIPSFTVQSEEQSEHQSTSTGKQQPSHLTSCHVHYLLFSTFKFQTVQQVQ